MHHEVRGDFAASHAYAQELLRRGQEQGDPISLLVGHRIVGASLFYLGRPTAAYAHLEQAVALYVPEEHRSLALVYGYDARVVSRFYLLETLFVLGYPDRALTLCREALAEARGLSPGSLAFALNHAGYAHHFRRERERCGSWRRSWFRSRRSRAFRTGWRRGQSLGMGTSRRGPLADRDRGAA